MRVVGYGICGPGEAKKSMRATLDEFKRLCDETVIVLNNATKEEYDLVKQYGFKFITDNREWGKHQWEIKQDFLDKYLSKMRANWCVTLDMDEVFDPKFCRKSIAQLNDYADSAYFYFVNLWEDGYKVERAFWNIRVWKWTGKTKMKQSALHCGLAPEWAYHHGVYSEYYVIHSGLKTKEDRQRKIERYAKYDPEAKFIDKSYYDSLHSDTYDELDYDRIKSELTTHWASSKPKKRKVITMEKIQRYHYVRRIKDGAILDIPERHLQQTLAQPGFELVGETIQSGGGEIPVDTEEVAAELFSDEVPEEPPPVEEFPVSEANPNTCVLCGFEGKNKRSLTMHTTKKH